VKLYAFLRDFVSFVFKLCLIIAGVIAAGSVLAQSYPTKPIRMLVAQAAGGPTDVVTRVYASRLSELLGQQVVVDNRPGAGGNIGMGIAASAAPDGYTLLAITSSYVLNPSLYSRVPYDPVKSFIPISKIAAAPEVFASHPSLPFRTLQDAVTLMRDDPKRRTISTPGAGTTNDLAAELFRLLIKLDLVKVPYNGGALALNAVMGNQVTLGCVSMPPAIPHIKSGRVRALGVTSVARSPSLPDVPTMAEAGYKLESEGLQGLVVPAGTPRPIVTRISNEVQRLVAQTEMRERITNLGYDVVGSTPGQFADQIRVDLAKWEKVIRNAGIKID
jgi:tripartite-type tricarboxylate transporter receptor subunit TctC